MAGSRAMVLCKRKSSKKRTTVARKKKKTGVTRSYTILRKSTINPKKKVSSQGKSATTTKTGSHLAARVALKRRTRPTRIYLYRKKKIMTYSIKYGKRKDGKVKAIAKLVRAVTVKRRKTSSKKKTIRKRKSTKKKRRTKKRKTPAKKTKAAEIARLRQRLLRLTR